MAVNVDVLLGQKSLDAERLGVKKTVSPRKDSKASFEVLTTKNDFVTKSSGLASIGLGENREVILISKNDVEYIVQKWNEFIVTSGHKIKKTSADPTKLLAFVSLFTIKSLCSEKGIDYIKTMVQKYKQRGDVIAIDTAGTDKRAAIPLHRFMVHKAAVCRQYTLINSIVMAHLVNTGHLPAGSVRQFRANVNDSAHAVATYISKGKIWVLENNNPSPFYLIPINQLNLNDPMPSDEKKRALRFIKLVGQKFYTEMFNRLLPNQTVVSKANTKAGADQAAQAMAARQAADAAAASAGNAAAGQDAVKSVEKRKGEDELAAVDRFANGDDVAAADADDDFDWDKERARYKKFRQELFIESGVLLYDFDDDDDVAASAAAAAAGVDVRASADDGCAVWEELQVDNKTRRNLFGDWDRLVEGRRDYNPLATGSGAPGAADVGDAAAGVDVRASADDGCAVWEELQVNNKTRRDLFGDWDRLVEGRRDYNPLAASSGAGPGAADVDDAVRGEVQAKNGVVMNVWGFSRYDTSSPPPVLFSRDPDRKPGRDNADATKYTASGFSEKLTARPSR